MGSTSLRTPGGHALRGSKRLLGLRDDEHLVARARAGEPVAFEVLYERHVPGILSFCRHMLGSREEAEDAVQQAFAAAHRDLVATERAINFKPWIYTIARNRCLSMLRVRRDDLPEDLERATGGLDAEVQARADLRELVTDLQDLPEAQRAALLLTEIRDLSHAEVAQVLDCETAQVKGLVHRARSGLLERREARDASCEEVRVELAAARGGGIRRGPLRHHLKSCPACSVYWQDVRQQRKMLALVLPVIPSLGLKSEVLAAIGIGGGTAGGGLAAGGAALSGAGAAATTGGGVIAGATVAKIAAVALIAGGAGVGISAVERDEPSRDRPPAKRSESQRRAGAGAAPASSQSLLPFGRPARRTDDTPLGGAGSGRRSRDGARSKPSPGRRRGQDGSQGRGGNRGGSSRGPQGRRNVPRAKPDRGRSEGRGPDIVNGGQGAPRGNAPPARKPQPPAQTIGPVATPKPARPKPPTLERPKGPPAKTKDR